MVVLHSMRIMLYCIFFCFASIMERIGQHATDGWIDGRVHGSNTLCLFSPPFLSSFLLSLCLSLCLCVSPEHFFYVFFFSFSSLPCPCSCFVRLERDREKKDKKQKRSEGRDRYPLWRMLPALLPSYPTALCPVFVAICVLFPNYPPSTYRLAHPLAVRGFLFYPCFVPGQWICQCNAP